MSNCKFSLNSIITIKWDFNITQCLYIKIIMLMTVNETAIHEKQNDSDLGLWSAFNIVKNHTVRDTIKGPCMTKKNKQTYPYLCLNQAKKWNNADKFSTTTVNTGNHIIKPKLLHIRRFWNPDNHNSLRTSWKYYRTSATNIQDFRRF